MSTSLACSRIAAAVSVTSASWSGCFRRRFDALSNCADWKVSAVLFGVLPFRLSMKSLLGVRIARRRPASSTEQAHPKAASRGTEVERGSLHPICSGGCSVCVR